MLQIQHSKWWCKFTGGEKKMRKTIVMILAMMLLMVTSVLAVTNAATTITFELTANVDMSVGYGTVDGTCTSADFYCRSNDQNAVGINISTSAGLACQNSTVSAITITNSGTVSLDVNMSMNATQTGATLKWKSTNDYSTSTELTAATALVCNDVATSGTCDAWLWCDYSSFLSGTAGTASKKINHNATQGS